jgi:hypothetical protein
MFNAFFRFSLVLAYSMDHCDSRQSGSTKVLGKRTKVAVSEGTQEMKRILFL